jgi:prolyl oligopeptidase
VRYPATRRDGVVDTLHGVQIADPYRWLEDIDSDETRTWVQQQNAVTQEWLAEVPGRDAMRAQLSRLVDHPRAGVPWQRNGRWFQLRNTGLQNQDVLFTMAAPDDAGRVLLDPNLLSDDGTVALSGLSVSPDGALLAYATSASGSDWMTWRIRDVASGRDLDDVVEWAKFSGAAWAPDASGFFYACYDEPAAGAAYEQINRNQRLQFHRVGTPAGEDAVAYQRPDQPEWGFAPVVTDDGRYLVVEIWRGTDPTNRLAYRDLNDPAGELTMLVGEADAAYDFVGNDGTVFFLRTDLDAPRGRVVAIDVREPGEIREVIGEGDDALEAVWLIGGRLLCRTLHHAAHRLTWWSLDGRRIGALQLPDVVAVDALSGRAADRTCCYAVTSFTAPTRVYRYDLDSGATTLLHDPGAGVDGAVTEQVFVDSGGVKVPVSIVRRADVEPDGERAVWLYGYGGFNIPLVPRWRSDWTLWVRLGGVVAVANLRGGGEYGQAWHDDGRLRNKQHTFDDAIAVAEHLIDTGWTRPGKIAINGGSNGGLLAGACLVQRPDLFGAAVPEVGVLDLLRFHKFTIGWAWTSDYGNPDEAADFAWIRALSPLHNLSPGTAYPPTLLVTGDHDDRVVPAHTYKFAAALQAAQGGQAPVLLRVETDAGHGMGKPISKVVAERADVVAFLARTLGLDARVDA